MWGEGYVESDNSVIPKRIENKCYEFVNQQNAEQKTPCLVQRSQRKILFYIYEKLRVFISTIENIL